MNNDSFTVLFLKRFLGLLFPIMLLTITLLHTDQTYVEHQIEQDITAGMEHRKARITSIIDDVGIHLQVVRSDQHLMDYLAKPDAQTQARLQQRLIEFAIAFQNYAQIRYLDRQGNEVIRINQHQGIYTATPPSQLQNKAHRYYFLNTFRLDQGQVFMSRFDLNVEHSIIETPHNPTIRIGTPVFDGQGNKQGVLLFNFKGQAVLDELERQTQNTVGDLMLVNEGGFWLYHPEPSKRWGFMFGNQNTFANFDPTAWEKIKQAQETLSVFGDQGLYAAINVLPHCLDGHASMDIQCMDNNWRLIHYLSPADLHAGPRQRLNAVLFYSPLLIGILFLIAWVWAKQSRQYFLHQNRIQQLSRVVEQSSELVYITDTRATILYVNPAFVRVTGYAPHEAIGHRASILRSGQHPPAFYERLWSTLAQGEPFKEIFINRTKYGGVYYEEKVITPIHDEHGTIVQYVSTGRDISQLNELEKRASTFENLAHHDALTGLPNRLYMIKAIKDAMARAERNETFMAVAMVDLDGFKAVNDHHGHEAGDELLTRYADRVSMTIRETDTFGRLGGDEFILLMEGFNQLHHIKPTLDKVLECANKPFKFNADTLEVSSSIGVVIYPFADDNEESLIQQADAAMYTAKHAGKNQIVFYESGMVFEDHP